MSDCLRQLAPWPTELEQLVEHLQLGPGWRASLHHDWPRDDATGEANGEMVGRGATRIVGAYPDAYHPERTIVVAHLFIVPAAAYNRAARRRWLIERYLDALRHEACGWFRIAGERPVAPMRGPGDLPHVVDERSSSAGSAACPRIPNGRTMPHATDGLVEVDGWPPSRWAVARLVGDFGAVRPGGRKLRNAHRSALAGASSPSKSSRVATGTPRPMPEALSQLIAPTGGRRRRLPASPCPLPARPQGLPACPGSPIGRVR